MIVDTPVKTRQQALDYLVEAEAISPATSVTALPWRIMQPLCQEGATKCSYVHYPRLHRNIMHYWLADPLAIMSP